MEPQWVSGPISRFTEEETEVLPKDPWPPALPLLVPARPRLLCGLPGLRIMGSFILREKQRKPRDLQGYSAARGYSLGSYLWQVDPDTVQS